MISAKESEERKRRMIFEAYQLFRDRGVDNVTFREVGARSGVSEASVYRYFKGKSELLQETHDYVWGEIITAVRAETIGRAAYTGCSGVEQVRRLIEAFGLVCLNHGDYLKLATDCKHYWTRRGFKIQGDRYDGVVGPMIALFYNAIQKGTADGTVRPRGEAQTLSFLLWGLLRTYVEEIVVFDAFYEGENKFRVHFSALQEIIFRLLCREDSVILEQTDVDAQPDALI